MHVLDVPFSDYAGFFEKPPPWGVGHQVFSIQGFGHPNAQKR